MRVDFDILIEAEPLVHPAALLHIRPMRHPTFARQAQAVVDRTMLGINVRVGPFARLYAGATIGDESVIADAACVRENAIVGHHSVIGQMVQIGHDCVIGDHVQIMDGAHLSGECSVGDGTFIGPRVCMANDDRPQGYKFKGLTPVRVGRNCLIGTGAILRAGITVGDGAIIAAGALVVKDVRAGAVVKGVPAQIFERSLAAAVRARATGDEEDGA